jgi:hypothetical protein
MAVFWDVTPRSLLENDRRFRGASNIGALSTEAVSTSETSFSFYQTTRLHVPEGSHLRTGRRDSKLHFGGKIGNICCEYPVTGLTTGVTYRGDFVYFTECDVVTLFAVSALRHKRLILRLPPSTPADPHFELT